MAQNMDKSRRVITLDDERAGLPNSVFLPNGGYTLNPDGSITIAGAVPSTATFLTSTDQSATLPQSRRLVAGTNITFDDTVANVRTINGAASGAPTFARKAANTIRVNNTVLPDPDLVLANLVAGTYVIQGQLNYQSDATAGFRFGLLCSAEIPASMSVGIQTGGGSTAVTGTQPIITTAATATALEPTTGNVYVFNFTYQAVFLATNTVSAQWAQATTTGGTNTTLRANSWISATRMA